MGRAPAPGATEWACERMRVHSRAVSRRPRQVRRARSDQDRDHGGGPAGYEAALAAALDSGHLYAAGLDVFEREPVALDNPLLQHPRVVVVPHIGSATTLTRAKMVDIAVRNASAVLLGQPMPRCVNPQVYLAEASR